jgi:hypothetical protein
MSAPDSPSASSAATPGVIGMCSVLLLYLLSPGLFVLCHRSGIKPPLWLETMLAPIAWACLEFPTVGRLYELYMRFLGAPI